MTDLERYLLMANSRRRATTLARHAYERAREPEVQRYWLNRLTRLTYTVRAGLG